MKYFCLITSLFIFAMCTDQLGKEKQKHLSVNLQQRDEVSIHDLFRHIEIIPLETDTDCLIQAIHSVKFEQQKFFIFDYEVQSLFVFNDKGEFLFKIAEKGQGPREYLNVSDFNINKYTNEIELLAPINNSIYRYDSEGKFIEKINLPPWKNGAYSDFYLLNQDTTVLWSYDDENEIKYYSRSKQSIVLETYPEYWDDNFCTFKFPGNDYFCRSLTNTVYHLGTNGLEAAYEWDFGEDNNDITKLVTTNDPKKNIERNLKIIRSEIANYVLAVQLSNSQYYYAKIIREEKFIHLFYDKELNKSLLFPQFTEGVAIHPVIMTDNYVIGLTGEDVSEVLQASILSDAEKEKLKQHKVDDNPILIKYEWKSNK